MPDMPTTLLPDHQTEIYTQETIPEEMTKAHTTPSGTWAFVRVLEGQLTMHVSEEDGEHAEVLSSKSPGIIEPEKPHRLEPKGEVRFYVQFFREPGT